MSSDNLSKLEVDLSAKRTKSLTLLKRINETVLEIVHDSTQTAVYNFNIETGGWEKAGIEGALFLTRNSVAPYYSVFVLNKLAPENFMLNLNTLINASCQSPFIMLRYATEGAPAIAGLWFHDDTSRNEMFAAVNAARERMKGAAPSALPTTSSPSKTNMLKGFLGKQTPVKTSATSGTEEGSSASKTNMLKGILGKGGNGEAPAAAPTETVFSASASKKLLGALKGGAVKEKEASPAPVAAAIPTKNDASKKLLGMLQAKSTPAPVPSSSNQPSREEKQREVVMRMMLGQEPQKEEKKEEPVEEPPKKPQALISPSDLFSM